MQQQYKSGKAVKSAQLKALQAQIKPHFLYNTLDLINWEAMDHGAPEIAEIAKSLARFYRISLNRGQQVVTIEQELRHVEAYVKIQNHHFDGAISLKTDVPEELLPLGCINIILQPLVENSIMHGIAEIPYIQECNVSISAPAGGRGRGVYCGGRRYGDDGRSAESFALRRFLRLSRLQGEKY